MEKKKITTLAMAYHVCPLPGYEWNLEQLGQYAKIFNGPKVVGLATLPKIKTEKIIDEIKSALGSDTVVKEVPNDPIKRESVTFPVIMRHLELKVDQNKTAIWYGHTKGITHNKSKKFKDVTKLWARACYHYTLEPTYLNFALESIEKGYAIAGPFRRFKHQKNFPMQIWDYHFSGTFFFLSAKQFFNSSWKNKIPMHRYGIEALPGLLFEPNLSRCTFGDDIKDLYKQAVWERLLPAKQIKEWMK